MVIYEQTSEYFKQMRRKTRAAISLHNSALQPSLKINARRIHLAAFFSLLARLVSIIYLLATPEPAPSNWRHCIILCHVLMLVFWIFAFLYSRQLEKKADCLLRDHAFVYVTGICVFAFGITITLFDQYITSSITPLILVSFFLGIILLLRPLAAFILYSLAFLSFYLLLPLVVSNQQILLSHRINSFSLMGLGLIASLLSWSYFVSGIRQEQKLMYQQKELEGMAFYDQLTGLCNRHLFNKLVEKELSEIERHGHSSVIIIFDIDDFKLINDQHGHAVGDLVLQQLSELVRKNIRLSDTVSRFGGEEFIILAPHLTLAEGFAFAEKLRLLIERESFATAETASFITASFGVSLLQTSETSARPAYFSLADSALYLAKQSGKNKTVKIK